MSTYFTEIPLVYLLHRVQFFVVVYYMILYVGTFNCFMSIYFTINYFTFCYIIYWAKVLPEQWELIQIFRKHEIFRKNLRMHFEQAIIHLSKSLNFIVIKCLEMT